MADFSLSDLMRAVPQTSGAVSLMDMIPQEKKDVLLSQLAQTWPAKLAQSAYGAVTAPGDAWSGKLQMMGPDGHTSPEAIGRAADLAGLMVATPGTPSGAVGSSARKLFDYSNLDRVPNVPQIDLARNIPPRGVPQRTLDITSDPGVRDKMLDTIAAGRDMGGANWYNADPLREMFLSELGKSKGDAAFHKYMDFVAATSPRSEVGANARNASYYYGREMRGEGMPAVGDRNPQPYGHMAQRLHQMNAERVAGAGWDPLNNPKPASFAENLTGNQAPVTVDTHAFRLPAILGRDERFLETAFQANKDAPKQNVQQMVKSGEMSMADAAARPAWWQSQPKANEYGAMEQYYKGLGQELGLSPAQTQAAAWVGGGKTTGLGSDSTKPFIGFFEDRVNKTAEATGMAPDEVMKKFIRGELPGLLSGAGLVAGAAASLPNENQQ